MNEMWKKKFSFYSNLPSMSCLNWTISSNDEKKINQRFSSSRNQTLTLCFDKKNTKFFFYFPDQLLLFNPFKISISFYFFKIKMHLYFFKDHSYVRKVVYGFYQFSSGSTFMSIESKNLLELKVKFVVSIVKLLLDNQHWNIDLINLIRTRRQIIFKKYFTWRLSSKTSKLIVRYE